MAVARDKNGRFLPGNQSSPGRKPKEHEVGVVELFKRCVGVEAQEGIIAKAVSMAMRGDSSSRKFIFDYLYGPPVQRNEVTGPEGTGIPIEVILSSLLAVYGDNGKTEKTD